jgi:uncharacterized protein
MAITFLQDKTLNILGQELTLLKERAIYFHQHETLLVSDIHLGKEHQFREHGLAIPLGSSLTDLERLTKLFQQYKVKKFFILGDLFHGFLKDPEMILDSFSSWRKEHEDIAMTLILGNHDRKARKIISDLTIEKVEESIEFEGITLKHEPIWNGEQYVIGGHIHPGFVMMEGRVRNRFPCFRFSEKVATLPAFGTFTGCEIIKVREEDRIFLVGK